MSDILELETTPETANYRQSRLKLWRRLADAYFDHIEDAERAGATQTEARAAADEHVRPELQALLDELLPRAPTEAVAVFLQRTRAWTGAGRLLAEDAVPELIAHAYPSKANAPPKASMLRSTQTAAKAASNKDVAVLAKKVYELSILTPEALEARKWEALLIVNAVLSSATPEGVQKTHADKEARWGALLRKEGILAALHPKWLLRVDDGKPPAVQHALASALDNPHRDLRTRLQALQLLAPDDRGPLTELARSLAADAWASAKGDARGAYVDVMRGLSPTWFQEPWLTVLPHDGQPAPISILIENQGATQDGGFHDDPTDDTEWEKVKFGWEDAIRTWDVDFLRDNPLAQLYLSFEAATGAAAETAQGLADDTIQAIKDFGKLLRWAPYVVAGVGVIGLTTAVVVAARR